jgi:hypothetical protein
MGDHYSSSYPEDVGFFAIYLQGYQFHADESPRMFFLYEICHSYEHLNNVLERLNMAHMRYTVERANYTQYFTHTLPEFATTYFRIRRGEMSQHEKYIIP